MAHQSTQHYHVLVTPAWEMPSKNFVFDGKTIAYEVYEELVTNLENRGWEVYTADDTATHLEKAFSEVTIEVVSDCTYTSEHCRQHRIDAPFHAAIAGELAA